MSAGSKMRYVVNFVAAHPGHTAYYLAHVMPGDNERGNFAAIRRAVAAGLVLKVDTRLYPVADSGAPGVAA